MQYHSNNSARIVSCDILSCSMNFLCSLIFIIFAFFSFFSSHGVDKVSSSSDHLIDNHPAWNFIDTERCGEAYSADRIIGGKDARLGQYPWLTALGYYNREFELDSPAFTCGGALITPCWVITAAHCIPRNEAIYLAVLRLGEYDREKELDCQDGICADPVQDFLPKRLLVHKDYNEHKIMNDIALVQLDKPARITKWVRPVCLPNGPLLYKDYEGQRMEVAGWGMYDPNLKKMAEILQTVTLVGVNIEGCQEAYPKMNIDPSRQICVGGRVGLDTCSGDSGGPMISVEANPMPKSYITGIVSFGTSRCAMPNKPAVYTSVGRYMKWILHNLTPC